MNGNDVGATTLAHLLGEKHLFVERERMARLKEMVLGSPGSDIGYSTPGRPGCEISGGRCLCWKKIGGCPSLRCPGGCIFLIPSSGFCYELAGDNGEEK
jgi:hypothetical protein